MWAATHGGGGATGALVAVHRSGGQAGSSSPLRTFDRGRIRPGPERHTPDRCGEVVVLPVQTVTSGNGGTFGTKIALR